MPGSPAPASARVSVDASMASSSPLRCVHRPHHVVHAGQLLPVARDDEVGALGDDLEIVVGDERGDLDDGVAGRVEPGHLQVHPGEHRANIPNWCGVARIGTLGACSTSRWCCSTPTCGLPAYARAGDAGADLVARRARSSPPAAVGRWCRPGSRLAIPDGYAGFVQPRSGLALRHGDHPGSTAPG